MLIAMKKRPEKTAQTEADLKEAFWRLYATRPVKKITVGQVCELAGYNRGTFYAYFQDIYALLDEIEDTLLVDMTACVETCMKRLRHERGKLSRIAACTDVMRYYERNKTDIEMALGERRNPAFVLRLKSNLKPLWREYVVDPHCTRPESEIDLLLEYTLTGTLFMISHWLVSPGSTSARTLAHLVYDFSIKEVQQRA